MTPPLDIEAVRARLDGKVHRTEDVVVEWGRDLIDLRAALDEVERLREELRNASICPVCGTMPARWTL